MRVFGQLVVLYERRDENVAETHSCAAENYQFVTSPSLHVGDTDQGKAKVLDENSLASDSLSPTEVVRTVGR